MQKGKFTVLLFLFFIVFLVLYSFLLLFFYEKRYRRKQDVDPLTGLLNSNGFKFKAEKMMNSLPRDCFLLIELNIRNFSFINRLCGSSKGDQLLVFIAGQLQQLQKKNSTTIVARGYADSFYILRKIDDLKENELIQISREQQIMQEELLKKGIQAVIKGGCAFSDTDHSEKKTISDLISKAGYARRFNRDSIINNFSVFDKQIQKQRETEERIESCMDKALTGHEFFVVFQPKISLTDKKIKGAEALVRWKSPENGMLQPDLFIPVFEKNGYAANLDFYVYHAVFEYLQQLINTDIPLIPVSLNISRLQQDAETFVTKFTKMLSAYTIAPEYIELEIVERAAGADLESLKEMTLRLQQSGFTVDMDDFGSGESSLNMLSEIPVDVVKFDRQFLKQAGTSNDSLIILSEMLKMVRELGKKTVCEGVETKEQVHILQNLGCDLAQGFYYSKPLLPEDFKDYLLCHL
jgi:EAL domain-containing protein (putative c-di-GMP-specific phosphodiesterase class I)/GGDEF domain-containing protein